ncbi:TPA: 50S ribosomal protein L18 [bacterium]|nr:50S ribosomal protein L18 [bacterium]
MISSKERLRAKRHRRIRQRIFGSKLRPRLNVFRSSKHIYAQVINDDSGATLVSASSLGLNLKGPKTEQAKEVGRLIGIRGKEKGIKEVVFDRGGYFYHGRVKALAQGAREAGLEF